jgi:uncharacterized protein
MIELSELRGSKRAALLQLGVRHGVTNIRVFGSIARGEQSQGSDVDFLVDLAPGRSIFDLAGFAADAEDLLGCRVDVVTPGGLQYLRERTLAEAVGL